MKLKMNNLLLVKPEKLEKSRNQSMKIKYFLWKETLLDCANQKPDWSQVTKSTTTWKARNEDATRGEPDATKRAHFNSYITYVATFAPGPLVHEIINESTENAYIDSRIRLMYQDFYYELHAVKYETLMKAGQEGTLQGKKITADKVMTPSIQNSIVVDWLAGIDEDLAEEVEQYYARDL